MKVACVQLDIAFGNPKENFITVEKKIRDAASLGADIIVLPEMWNTGYDLTRLAEIADVEGEDTKRLLTKLSKELSIHIVGGSVSTKKGDNFFNTMYVVNSLGEIIAEYDKAHLFKLMDEHHYLEAGNGKNLFSLDGIEMGGIICYDLRFPEWIRSHVLDGAKIIFVPAQWPDKRIDHWKILLQARAIENQCYVVAVNRVGKDPNNSFNGNSMVIAPWGEILWTGENEETVKVVELTLSEIEEVRKRIPIFQDRRETLYK
ncbi:carbon-nitrogen family hydrolase [Psychrobacillus vulpis]|uniref:Carbon-nitrogen family hydrolase n=1 Tax=Psychrobacillus vulpis TaxID=2325572 RepID=A0A544TFH7_9BACI|nr:carbon-nitrogen family hydrolase [Psychrobacillus vulpis]TQR16212.1 carbon-nitrogen family hydrolase [Psychrobacillus vulpis]